MRIATYLLFCCLSTATAFAQQVQDEVLKGRGPFTHADTLRGTLGPARACYDVTYYNLQLRINPKDSSLAGSNTITFRAVTDFTQLQVDLFAHYAMDSVVCRGHKTTFLRKGNALFVQLEPPYAAGDTGILKIAYHGKPTVARNPPWQGGFVWHLDEAAQPWVGVACEGLGASSWWPLKDHPADKPDSMRMVFTIPHGLECVANGVLHSVLTDETGWDTYDWRVNYPINSYNVTVNLGNYTHFSEVYTTDTSQLDLDYYVLAPELVQARKHFAQVKPMLNCYGKLIGPYPFPRDGYALVETPYYGMEHQGAIAYGNHYHNNAFGWDYIIVHESAHEWFGNSITANDHADLWIQEAFADYMEALYVECLQGKVRAQEYLNSIKVNIENTDAIQGPRGVNFDGWHNSDMYYKGAWMLHTLRTWLNDDTRWFAIIHKLPQVYGHSLVSSEDIINYFVRETGLPCGPFFTQYLRYIQPPTLQYNFAHKGKKTYLRYRWLASAPGFTLTVGVLLGDKKPMRLTPTQSFQTLELSEADRKEFAADTDGSYVLVQALTAPPHK